jgi:hypothetical protein
VTLLHPPYTLWHLSYVAIGATLAPEWRPARLGAALAAFLLAMGVGAHALDELNGRPLRTAIPDRVLWALAVTSIAGGVAIGVVVAALSSLWLLVFVAFGGFIVVAYNLELFGGRFHTDVWFALAWGALPLLATYFATAERLRASAILAASFAALLSLAQRRLSTPVRFLRRRVTAVTGALEVDDGSELRLTREELLRAPEEVLRALAAAVVALAVALVVLRVE